MKALVLNSGGVDSTTCVALAIEKFGKENVVTATLYYGQRHDKELECARKVAEHYGVRHIEEDISCVMKYAGDVCSLMKDSKSEIPDKSYAEQIAENGEGRVGTYVPFRNGLLLSIATAYADSLFPGQEAVVVYGAHADDAAGNAYADCSEYFADAMDNAISIGTYGKIHVWRPLIALNKAGVVGEGLRLNVPYELTWSCLSVEEKVFGLRGYTSVGDLHVGDYVWGYTDKWTPAKVENITLTGRKKTYKVILQDQIGRLTSFRCTGDHRLMLRDGTYKMLCECKVGDSLMPASFYLIHSGVDNGYMAVHPHNSWKEKTQYLHRIAAEYFGILDEVVHHKNHNTQDNSPENLEGMKWGAHSALADTSSSHTKEAEESRRSKVKEWWANMSPEEYALQCELISEGRAENHRIKSIIPYGEEDTFDIQTSTSNFAIAAGIFVHNCYKGEEKACGTCGTCIAEGTPVIMADGTQKAIETLKPGDMVWSMDEETGRARASKVLNVVCQGEKPVHTIGGIRMTEDHRVYVRSAGGSPFFREASTLKRTDAEYFGYTFPKEFLFEEDDEQFALGYLRGFAEGDGHIGERGVFTCQDSKDVLDEFWALYGKYIAPTKCNVHWDPKREIFIGSGGYGPVFAEKTAYSDNPSYLRGYLNGMLIAEGCGAYNPANKSFAYVLSQSTSANPEKCEMIDKAFVAYGMEVTVWENKSLGFKAGGSTMRYWRFTQPWRVALRYGASKRADLFRRVFEKGAPMHMDQVTLEHYPNPAGSATVWDIETEGHTFFAGALLVHNCIDRLAAFEANGVKDPIAYAADA